MIDHPMIRASREAFGHEPDPVGSRPFPAWVVILAALAGIVPPLVLVGVIAWRVMG